MRTALDRPDGPVDPIMADALAMILSELAQQATPRAVDRTKAAMLAKAHRLETWKGCRILPANVVNLDSRRQAPATEAQRIERAQLAAGIRRLLDSF